MTLPVAIVQFGYLFSELAESARFRNMYQFILETRSQTFAEEVVKRGMVPMNQSSILIELDSILVESVTILHVKVTELGFRISNRIVDPKVILKLLDQMLKGYAPGRRICRIRIENFRFEPIKCRTSEIGKYERDFLRIRAEHVGTIVKVKVHIDKKGSKFAWVVAIKRFGFLDFRFTVTGTDSFENVCEAVKGIHEFAVVVGRLLSSAAGGSLRTARRAGRRPTARRTRWVVLRIRFSS